MSKRLVAAAVAVLVLVGGTAVAHTEHFSDVSADHPAADAIGWAAHVGLTVGYGDGTFGPDGTISRWQAVTFMERYFDDILAARESPDFTRGDMMRLLHSINTGLPTASGGDISQAGYLYGGELPKMLGGPGLYRFVVYLHTDEQGRQTPVRMVDLGAGLEHVLDRSGHVTFMEVGCGYDPARLAFPEQYMYFGLVGPINDGIVYYQRLMDCLPELDL